ncbi:MAG TPA: hypothetical protein VGG64_25195 [Pirellulales bacterium]|jgi:hypothetical protein
MSRHFYGIVLAAIAFALGGMTNATRAEEPPTGQIGLQLLESQAETEAKDGVSDNGPAGEQPKPRAAVRKSTITRALMGSRPVSGETKQESVNGAPQKPGQEVKAVVAYGTAVLLSGGAAAPAAEPKEADKIKKKGNEAKVESKKPGTALGVFLNAVPAAALPIKPAEAQANQALIQQFVMQFQPLAKVELLFIRQICPELTLEQRAKVKAAVDASVKDAAEQQAQLQMPQVRVNRARVARAAPQPAKIIRTAVATVLKESLTPEQWARYDEEALKRTAHRKHAATLCAISRLDAVLCLTPEQRDKLTKSITDSWQDDWESWLMLSMYGNQYMPQIPDTLVVPHLTVDQTSVWRGLQKVNFANWNVFNGQQANDENDDWWEGKAPRPAAPNGLKRLLDAFKQ